MIKHIKKTYHHIKEVLLNFKISDDPNKVEYYEDGKFRFDDDYGYYLGHTIQDQETLNIWLDNNKIDESIIAFPIVVLVHIEIYDEFRKEGNGNALYLEFENLCTNNGHHNIIAECDNTICQFGGFSLSRWFDSLGFHIIGNRLDNSIMYKNI